MVKANGKGSSGFKFLNEWARVRQVPGVASRASLPFTHASAPVSGEFATHN